MRKYHNQIFEFEMVKMKIKFQQSFHILIFSQVLQPPPSHMAFRLLYLALFFCILFHSAFPCCKKIMLSTQSANPSLCTVNLPPAELASKYLVFIDIFQDIWTLEPTYYKPLFHMFLLRPNFFLYRYLSIVNLDLRFAETLLLKKKWLSYLWFRWLGKSKTSFGVSPNIVSFGWSNTCSIELGLYRRLILWERVKWALATFSAFWGG